MSICCVFWSTYFSASLTNYGKCTCVAGVVGKDGGVKDVLAAGVWRRVKLFGGSRAKHGDARSRKTAFFNILIKL